MFPTTREIAGVPPLWAWSNPMTPRPQEDPDADPDEEKAPKKDDSDQPAEPPGKK